MWTSVDKRHRKMLMWRSRLLRRGRNKRRRKREWRILMIIEARDNAEAVVAK